MDIINDLANKSITVEEAAKAAIEHREILADLLEGIVSKKDEIRFNSYQILLHISEVNPEIFYSKWDDLAALLISDNHYHRYIAINLIANLVMIDTENKFEADFENYFDNIAGEKTMVAGQTAMNAGKIAKAKPGLQTRITEFLLKIDKIHRGKQIELMKAYAIASFDYYFDEIAETTEIINFVKENLNSESPKTRKAAKEFLSKWQITDSKLSVA
ncbi:MAG: hypothetical protein MUC94_15350 [bacterium]|jgi:hypothetical protein|nr:hypothetical protein [bacterium]